MRSSAPPSPAGPSRKSPRGVGLSSSAAEMDLGCRPLPLSPLPARCHPHYAAPTTALAARCPLQPTIKVSACIDLHRPCLLPPSPPSASYCPHRPLLSTTAHYHPLPSLPPSHPPSATHPHPPPPSIGLKPPSLPPPRLPFHLRSLPAKPAPSLASKARKKTSTSLTTMTTVTTMAGSRRGQGGGNGGGSAGRRLPTGGPGSGTGTWSRGCGCNCSRCCSSAFSRPWDLRAYLLLLLQLMFVGV